LPNLRLVTWYQRRLGLGFTSKPTLIQFFVAVAPSLCCPRGQLLPLLRLLSQSFHSRPPSRPRAPFPGRRFVEDSPSLRIRRPDSRTSAPSAPSTCASRRIRSLRAVDLRILPSAGSALCHPAVRRIRPLPRPVDLLSADRPPDPPSVCRARSTCCPCANRRFAQIRPPSLRTACSAQIQRPGSAQIRLLSDPAVSAVPLSLVTIAVTSSCGQGCRSAPLLSLRRWLPLRAELRWP
jgi:hypothetical protein